METQRDSPSLARWSLLLLLLGLVITPAASRTLTYREAVLRVVDSLNQRSSEENFYRLLQLDSQPEGDENPNIPKPVSFTVKETVCPKTTQKPLEECDFKDNGLVKRCDGTVILDADSSYYDINCDEALEAKFGRLRNLIEKAGQNIRGKIQGIGRRIKDILKNLQPRPQV
ncbi:cathelicidin antimicrobial peptide [Ailuropoda melanoleuca]|uniref:Cathelicidin antimicrobial peptide n=1 Tax=Ailuropoda melanoleuca TaxID=9646 RepID=G1L3J9_AILME|nr:cathelicidin antimicrobial peptide [Ailuropoda melanoleuca]